MFKKLLLALFFSICAQESLQSTRIDLVVRPDEIEFSLLQKQDTKRQGKDLFYGTIRGQVCNNYPSDKVVDLCLKVKPELKSIESYQWVEFVHVWLVGKAKRVQSRDDYKSLSAKLKFQTDHQFFDLIVSDNNSENSYVTQVRTELINNIDRIVSGELLSYEQITFCNAKGQSGLSGFELSGIVSDIVGRIMDKPSLTLAPIPPVAVAVGAGSSPVIKSEPSHRRKYIVGTGFFGVAGVGLWAMQRGYISFNRASYVTFSPAVSVFLSTAKQSVFSLFSSAWGSGYGLLRNFSNLNIWPSKWAVKLK